MTVIVSITFKFTLVMNVTFIILFTQPAFNHAYR